MSEFLKLFTYIDNQMPFYVELAGITYPDSTYHITRTNSQVSVIEYIIDGAGYVVLDNQPQKVQKDMVYFLQKGENHNYYSDPKVPFTKIFLNVKGSLCEHLALVYGVSKQHFFSGEGLKPSFLKILDIIKSGKQEGEMQAELQGVFVEILSKLCTSVAETQKSQEAITLKNYLDANLGRQVLAKELANKIFRSKDYCQKLFIKEFNTTPYAYQLERKIQTAKSLLVNTQMSVTEIAESLGYGDSHYFSNLFYNKCGIRPTAYRKNKR